MHAEPSQLGTSAGGTAPASWQEIDVSRPAWSPESVGLTSIRSLQAIVSMMIAFEVGTARIVVFRSREA